MHRYILTALGCFALATAFSITPLGLQDASLTLGAKSALAQPGGQGKGKGKGRGQARGHGNSETLNGVANGYSGDKSANGRALGHEVDGVSGVGHATAPGQAKKAAYDGYDGYDDKDLKGSFNAINASKRAFEVSNYHSRLQRVQSYLDAIRDLSLGEGDTTIEDAAGFAAAASSQPVTKEMLDEVNRISNEKDLTNPPSDIDLENAPTDEVATRAAQIQEGP